MALYERTVDGGRLERVFTVDGSDRDREMRDLAEAGTGGWEHVTHAEAPAGKAKPAARPRRGKAGG